jgi:hypothetical protein
VPTKAAAVPLIVARAVWPAYLYWRVTVELHGEGRLVNHKKVMRLMKENGLTVTNGAAGFSGQEPGSRGPHGAGPCRRVIKKAGLVGPPALITSSGRYFFGQAIQYPNWACVRDPSSFQHMEPLLIGPPF